MADSRRDDRSKRARSPWSALPALGTCCLLVASCVAFAAYGPGPNPADPAPGFPSSPAEEPPSAGLGPPAPKTADGMDLLGSYHAISQSTNENRAVNVKLAAEAIDEVVVQPDQTFSFNDSVGDTEHDERYLMAPVICGDEMVDGRGGGICQVSTALYIAALKSGLDIVERHAHTLVSDYAPVGLDATLAYGLLDLKIQNNSGYPIKIAAQALGQSVVVSIYGHALPPGVSYDATSKVVGQYQVDEGSSKKEGGQSPGTYYVAEAFRVSYLNGVISGSTLLSTDTYKVEEGEALTLGEGSVEPTK